MSRPQNQAYRYWRIVVIANNGAADYSALAETQMKSVAGGSNLLTASTPVTASSSLDGNYTPANTVDGNVTTYWVSAINQVTNQWLLYDLGTQVKVAQIALYSNNTPATRNPRDIRVEASNDGVNFDVKGTFLNQTTWDASFKTFDL